MREMAFNPEEVLPPLPGSGHDRPRAVGVQVDPVETKNVESAFTFQKVFEQLKSQSAVFNTRGGQTDGSN